MTVGCDTTNVNYCIQICKHNANADPKMCIASIFPSLFVIHIMWYFSTMVIPRISTV